MASNHVPCTNHVDSAINVTRKLHMQGSRVSRRHQRASADSRVRNAVLLPRAPLLDNLSSTKYLRNQI